MKLPFLMLIALISFQLPARLLAADNTAPKVIGVSPLAGSITNLNQITVMFDEPVMDVTAEDLLINGVAALILTPVNASTFTFDFLQPAPGTIKISWREGQEITDLASPANAFIGTAPGAFWSYELVDKTAPSMVTVSPVPDSTLRSLTNIAVLFSEPVSGLQASDLRINNTPATSVTLIPPTQYIFTFAQPAGGIVDVLWATDHGITDQAVGGNPFAGGSWKYNLDPSGASSGPYISEFMASNTKTLFEEPKVFPDWIEIYNPGPFVVNLEGWALTDSRSDLAKWRFPATNLASGSFLVVLATGNDRRIPGPRLHTNFQLSSDGEYLALVKPDGSTVASEFGPVFPPQAIDVSYGWPQFENGKSLAAGTNAVYFVTPTAGAANLGGTLKPGPVIQAVQHLPNVPLDVQDLTVTARVLPSFFPIASVQMRYRIMFSNEVSTVMLDDGAHGDGAAGDGIYGASIPANLSTNGQMIRYLISAVDSQNSTSRWPLFSNASNTAEYLGTIVDPTNLVSKLPIFHLFVSPQNISRIDTESGGRLSLFYDGEFYDNIYMELRGNTSAGYNKKSHRLEFNRDHELRHPGSPTRTRKSALLAEYVDPAYLRQYLCFWFLNMIGVPSPFDYPVRAQMNNAFYQLAFHNDVIGQEQMERMGYDPTGALYKAVGTFTTDFYSTGVFQKLEPDTDTTRIDYLQLANGIKESVTATVRRVAVFDLLDVPEVINHLSGARWCSENDDVWANMSMYRDTFGDGLWRNIPFDMNASWGQLYGGSSPLEATVDGSKSHPLYGGSTTGGTWNRLYDVIVTLPETRAMLLRRQRTIMDKYILPPETPTESLIIENHIKYMTNLISVEANLDRAKWGFSPWAGGKTFAIGVGDLLTQFVGPRRRHWYATHSVTNGAKVLGIRNANNAGIPVAQPLNATLVFAGVEFNPSSGDQNHEFLCLSNPAPVAIDITGWKIDGGYDFTFAPGTIITSNGVIYVSPNTRAFRSRPVSPKGGEGNFVVGPAKGHLSARGETIRIKNDAGELVHTFTYGGAPSPAQQFLRITELMFHPSANPASTNAEDFEYIELRNTSTNVALDLSGVRLTNGVGFNFTGSAVTNLGPGARVLVVKNRAAFIARYGSGFPIAGEYLGNLDNSGERLILLDRTNEEILDFSYNNSWQPLADGLGFSLVVAAENAEPDAWGRESQWRASSSAGGAPGLSDPALALSSVIITEVLTRDDTGVVPDSVELHNPADRDVNISGWWLSDDFTNPKKFRIPNGTVMARGGYRVFTEAEFNNGPAGFALSSSGDEVWLFSTDAAGNLNGYYRGESFGAADDGVSFGLVHTSDGKSHFIAQKERTLGRENSGALVGPVIINEIMYHPPDLADGNDNSQDEFIELRNITTNAVPLFDPGNSANTWKITGGIDFSFPLGQTIAPSGYLLLVNFSPTNATRLAEFRAKYNVPASIMILGPYGGQLNNSNDKIELKKPTHPVSGQIPFVLVDKVEYHDSDPWPTAADGTGLSLHRADDHAIGAEPGAWIAAAPSAGSIIFGGPGGPAISAQPHGITLPLDQSAMLTVTATGKSPLGYQWRRNGSSIAGATNLFLQLDKLQPGQGGDYDVIVYNGLGSVVSSVASVSIAYPPSFPLPPISQQVRVAPDPSAKPTNATFNVLAFGAQPLRYQWRFNGRDIPGATTASLTITNVEMRDGGEYTVAVTDPNGLTGLSATMLYPLVTPTIVQAPLGQTVAVGTPVTLSVAVNGSPLPITYEWKFGTRGISTNVTASTVDYQTILATNIPTTLVYSVVVKNLAYQGSSVSSLVSITTVADTDGDGIPDEYEAQYGKGGKLDPKADDDGDGATNLAEYIAGTDPTDPKSYLRIDSLAAAAGASLQFGAVSNRTYTIEFTDALRAGSWQKLNDIAAQGSGHPETVTDPNYTTNRFYRIAVPRRP